LVRKVEVRALSSDGKINPLALHEGDKAVAQELGEVPQAVQEAAAKRRNTIGDVEAARERYLARKYGPGREKQKAIEGGCRRSASDGMCVCACVCVRVRAWCGRHRKAKHDMR
jgi:hypothetical protein